MSNVGARRRPSLQDLIAAYLEEIARGQRPDRRKLLARHPTLRKELRSFFELNDRMERFSSPLRKLAGIETVPHRLGRLGPYELQEVIGGGGMGLVYLARHTLLDRTVALKMIRSGRLATAEARQRFHREARAAAAMSHPNIVEIYDFGECDGQPYYTMRLIEPHLTLDEDERDFRSEPAEAARLVAKVARAVQHAHQRKIIHRDLKPGNILIDPAGHPLVTDFGLAMTIEAGARATDPDPIGTLPYMSPEQLSVRPKPLTTAVDVWSLGAILYELLAGRIPFRGADQRETIELIRSGAPAPLRALNPAVPRELEAICLRCLEKKPERRFGSASALAARLEAWLEREATRLDRFIREARRTELRQELLHASSADADRVLMKLMHWGSAVLEAADDPELPGHLQRRNPGALQEFLERVRRTFDDPARGFATPEETSPFESWILLNDRGRMVACSPDASIVGQDHRDREWYRGAREHDGKRGFDAVHVSKVFVSVLRRSLFKFSLSVPVYAGRRAGAPVIGVLGASFTTHANLGLARLSDERHKVVVAGRRDPRSDSPSLPDDYLVLVHPAYRRGEPAVRVDTPILRTFTPKPQNGELRPPDSTQVGGVDEDFKDPLAARDARYEGRWWAGVAPVGNTPFVTIVQRRPDPQIERQHGIPVGLLVDLTGVTSSVSEPYAEGLQAYADWFNAQGGIAGKKVRLVRVDYANRIHEALEIYTRFKTVDRVVAIQGWGTGDSEALRERVSRDEIPFMSASYSASLADPRKAPYNFFVAADYSTQLRAALRYLHKGWKQPRRPRVAFVFPDLPYGASPILAGTECARDLGFDIVGQEHVALNAGDAARQVTNLRKRRPDFTWIGGTTPSTIVLLKEARRQKFRSRFVVSVWGNDEDLVRLGGDTVEGVLGLQASVLFGDDVPGMKAIREATAGEAKVTHFVRGWVSMMVLCEGLRRAQTQGGITGPAIKRGLETLRDFDPQGLMPAISFTPQDHRPSTAVRIYEFSRGRMRHRGTIQAERRPEWLGY